MIKCDSVFGNVFQYDDNQDVFGTVYSWCVPVNNDGYRYIICGPSKAVFTLCGMEDVVYKICNQQVTK